MSIGGSRILLGNYYIPAPHTLNVRYFNELCIGKKFALRNYETNRIKVAKFRELSAKFALHQCLFDTECFKYIPSHWFEDTNAS